MGSQRPRQAIGCNFPCHRVIFDVDNAKSAVKWMQKRVQDISKERFQTLSAKLYSYLFKLIDFNRKNFCVVMQSGKVA